MAEESSLSGAGPIEGFQHRRSTLQALLRYFNDNVGEQGKSGNERARVGVRQTGGAI